MRREIIIKNKLIICPLIVIITILLIAFISFGCFKGQDEIEETAGGISSGEEQTGNDEDAIDGEAQDTPDNEIEDKGDNEAQEEETSGQEELESEEGLAENEIPVDSDKIAQENENIRVTSPLQNQVVSSPLIITGEARGMWFFEACFPVKLLDGNGEEIAAHYATALSDWMTEDFVPFEATFEFEKPDTEIGFLVLERDNPSGLPEYDDELIIAVRFGQ